MLKTKDGYAKVIGTSYLGSSDYLLLSNGDSKAISSLSVSYANSAGNADTLDDYHENSFLRHRGNTNIDQEATLWNQIGIKLYNNALPDNLTDVYNYGSVISLPGFSSRFEIYASHLSSNGNGLYYRSGWGSDKKTWLKFIDSSNIGSQSVNYANSASKWATARELSLTGSITGSVSFDGSGNITLNTTYGTGNITNLDSRYLKKTGDTMSGTLSFSPTDSSDAAPKIYSTVSGALTSLNFEVSDDANDRFVFRINYYGDTDTTNRERFTIDWNNVISKAPITAPSFIGNASTATDADTVDGYHANSLLTDLSNSNNGISITVGGTTKSVSNISVNYAASAGSVAWNNVTGIPSTFAPSAHTHKWADITDHITKLSLLTNDTGFVTGSVSGETITINGSSTTWSDTWRPITDNYELGESDTSLSSLGSLTLYTDLLGSIPNPTDYYWANVKISTSSNTQTTPTFNTAYATDWFRAKGNSGFYFLDHAGGWYMSDNTWIRTWNSTALYVNNTIRSTNYQAMYENTSVSAAKLESATTLVYGTDTSLNSINTYLRGTNITLLVKKDTSINYNAFQVTADRIYCNNYCDMKVGAAVSGGNLTVLNNSYLALKAGAKVGIGTSNPLSTLDVAGTSKFQDTATFYDSINANLDISLDGVFYIRSNNKWWTLPIIYCIAYISDGTIMKLSNKFFTGIQQTGPIITLITGYDISTNFTILVLPIGGVYLVFSVQLKTYTVSFKYEDDGDESPLVHRDFKIIVFKD